MNTPANFMFSDSIDEKPAAPVLILGLGNCLLEDEGIGIAAIEYLHQHYDFEDDVELLDGGTTGMGLLDDLRNRRQVIVLDAVNTGRPPGDLVVLNNEEVPAFFRGKVSPHQLALSDVLAVLTLTDEQPRDIRVVGVQPVSLQTRIGLSQTVKRQLLPMVNHVVNLLRSSGCRVQEKIQADSTSTDNPLQII